MSTVLSGTLGTNFAYFIENQINLNILKGKTLFLLPLQYVICFLLEGNFWYSSLYSHCSYA